MAILKCKSTRVVYIGDLPSAVDEGIIFYLSSKENSWEWLMASPFREWLCPAPLGWADEGMGTLCDMSWDTALAAGMYSKRPVPPLPLACTCPQAPLRWEMLLIFITLLTRRRKQTGVYL